MKLKTNYLSILLCFTLFAATGCDKKEKEDGNEIIFYSETHIDIYFKDLSVEKIQDAIRGKWWIYAMDKDNYNSFGGAYRAFYGDRVIFEDLDYHPQTFYCTWEKRKITFIDKYQEYGEEKEIEAFVLCRNNDKDEFIFFNSMTDFFHEQTDSPHRTLLYAIIGFGMSANIHVVYHRYKHWDYE